MARIADKHGLTNAYRAHGSKRLVKRGRPRKYLFGKNSRRKTYYRSLPVSCKNNFTTKEFNSCNQSIAGVVVLGIVLLFLFSIIPIFRCMIPIAIGLMLVTIGDKVLKKIWHLSDGKWSMPASMGWLLFSCLMMCVSMFIILLIQIEEVPLIALEITIVIYVVLSFVILFFKHRKIYQSNHTIDYVDSDENFDCYDIETIDDMDGYEFEEFCAELLISKGFSDVCVTKESGDQGVDILAVKDGIKYAIQCKNYATSVGNASVQQVNAGKVFYNCHVGVVITNSTFTRSACELAQATGVLLWDRSILQEFIDD